MVVDKGSKIIRRIAVEGIEAFRVGSRGPELQSWLHDTDLVFPSHHKGFGAPPGGIVGARVSGGWVIWHGLQVVKVIPEEVHSYWHGALPATGPKESNVWLIEESDWLGSFNPRHLSECHHFVLEFYDHVVEVVTEALIFGAGRFRLEEAIAQDGRLGYAHLRRALSLEKEGKLQDAEVEFVAYLATDPPESSRKYAKRCLKSLRQQL